MIEIISKPKLPAKTSSWLKRAQSSQPASFWIIILLALLFEATWLLFINVGFFMDSVTYLQSALALMGRELDWGSVFVSHEQTVYAFARRSIGYPILMVASGLPLSSSTLVILIEQAAMAVAIPALAFKIVQPFHARAAFWTGLILILTLEPFNYSKVISSDHTAKFLLVLIVYLASLVYRTPSSSLIGAIGVVGLLLTLNRPEHILITILVFVMLAIRHPKWWKTILGCFFGVALAISSVSLATCLYVVPDIPIELWPKAPQRIRNSVGDRLSTLAFYNVYAARNADLAQNSGAPSDVRRDLEIVLKDYADKYVSEWSAFRPRQYFGRFSGNASEFVAEIYRNPNPLYLGVVRMAIAVADSSNDPQLTRAANHLMWRLNWSIYRDHPEYAISFIKRFLLSSSTSTTGEQIFLTMYTRLPGNSFKASNGPASQQILELMRVYCRDFPDYLPGQWRDDPTIADRIGAEFSKNPSEGFWFFMREAVDRLRGKQESSSLFLQAAKEFNGFWPIKIERTIDNLGQFLIGVPTVYRTGVGEYDDAATFVRAFSSPILPQKLQHQILGGMKISGLPDCMYPTSPNNCLLAWGIYYYTPYWLSIRTLLIGLGVATFLFSFLTGTGWLATLILTCILAEAAAISALTDVQTRYIDQFLPLAVILAGLSVGSFVVTFAERLARRSRENSGEASLKAFDVVVPAAGSARAGELHISTSANNVPDAFAEKAG